jgi:nucleotidyltransferase substrate binding protein (TIGR01987 family)
VRDSAIQRFEISFELCWKFLKAYLEEQHNALYTLPRTCFRSAFRHGVIDNDPFWIDLTVLRIIRFIPITSSLPITCTLD